MASLGLDQPTGKLTRQSKISCPLSPPSPDPVIKVIPSPVRIRSTPSLRDTSISRYRVARYSPYVSNQPSNRRSSLSSISSNAPKSEGSPSCPYSTSPCLASSKLARPSNNQLSVQLYEVPANTPISTYVRRKTPGLSPTSPTFPRDVKGDISPAHPLMPFALPTLPSILPHSPRSNTPPGTPTSDTIEVQK